MPLVTPREESINRAGGFYVPQFEVLVEGAGLPDDVLRDVTELTYSDKIEEIDSFQISVLNWDQARDRCKYIGSETRQALDAPADDPERLFKLFEPCNKEVEIRMGYLGYMVTMMKGTFSTMEPNFPSGGPPVLSVRGLNVLHQLRRKKYSGEWSEKKDSEIAENIATLRDRELNNAARFPLPIAINPGAKAAESTIFFVGQRDEYDIDFLWKRARVRGYVVCIQEETEGNPRQLYFGPSANSQEQPTYHLEWGKSLVEFKPTLTTANQFRSVTVRGWDRARQRAIEETVDFDDPELNRLNPDLHDLVSRCDPREQHVVTRPVFSTQQARDMARALLMDQSKQMVKATGTTVGLPELRAGSRVLIGNVGSRLSGEYFVTETTHTVNDSGYLTRFTARREDPDTGEAL